MKEYQFIKTIVERQIGRIILNRPDVHNAWNIEMIREFSTAIQELNQDKSVRILLIESRGKNFSSGADLKWMKDGLNLSEKDLIAESEELAGLFSSIYNSSKITIVYTKGKNMGGANGILSAADIVIASEDTKLAFTEVKLGLIPATIAPYVVQKVGMSAAKEWMLSGRIIDAEEAMKKGLIHIVIKNKNEVEEYLNNLLKNGPKALEGIKLMFRNEMNHLNPDAQLKKSAKLIASYRVSTEGQEGIKAFLEKRMPDWRNE